jgi:hypothetical protein
MSLIPDRSILLSTLAFDSRVLPTRSPRPARLRGLSLALPLLGILLCSSCANHHFRVTTETPPTATPRYVELLTERQVATLHFPAGTYSFYAVDDIGLYYRAPRPIIQHTGGASVARKGGIFVSKRNPKKLRGYVFYAGALTHVGDLSRVPHVFKD